MSRTLNIEQSGITVNTVVNGSQLKIKILHQTPEFTQAIKDNVKRICDTNTTYGLWSNKKPNFRTSSNLFYVRGEETQHDNLEVIIERESPEEARLAQDAFERLIEKVENPEIIPPVVGSTTHIRHSFINKQQARMLNLTGSKHYPDECAEWPGNVQHLRLSLDPTKVDIPGSVQHWHEHVGQGVDVLNKSVENVPTNYDGSGIVNPHRVSTDDAKFAIDLVKEGFSKAQEQGDGALVAFWRTLTSLRAPDIKDIVEDDDELDDSNA